METQTLLEKYRLAYQPGLPLILNDLVHVDWSPSEAPDLQPEIKTLFPKTYANPVLNPISTYTKQIKPLNVGVVLSGGQAPGGHNVIAGLFDALKKIEPSSRLFGFLDGPKGIVENQSIELTKEMIDKYRNLGGFNLIGSGRTKIETPEQFTAADKTVRSLNLDGLVIIGGDDSNTNAALLAEYFLEKGNSTTVVGVPKTIDGDLKNQNIEISFGFDTASKNYSETIGNIMRDTLSAKKSYYFIKLMGRSASHITLECALQTHPNYALISEEVASKGQTLHQVTSEICDLICQRSNVGKDYGVLLIAEGVIEFIPEFRALIEELNHASGITSASDIVNQINPEAKRLFLELPEEIKSQLLMDRDPHGNVQVSKIETERLMIKLVEQELKKRKKAGTYKGKFSAQPHFCGYEGRSCFPSNFDCQYCYALGHVAALLVSSKATGYICCIENLTQPVSEWQIKGVPIASMMTMETREGKSKPVIKKALVDLNGKPFDIFKSNRFHWTIQDDYLYPGPVQFFGPGELTDELNQTLILENN